jgi:hypothetical protein
MLDKFRPYLNKNYALDIQGFMKQLKPRDVFERDVGAASSDAENPDEKAASGDSGNGDENAASSDSGNGDGNAVSSDSNNEDENAAFTDDENEVAKLMATCTVSTAVPSAQQGRGPRKTFFNKDLLESAEESKLIAFLTRIRTLNLTAKREAALRLPDRRPLQGSSCSQPISICGICRSQRPGYLSELCFYRTAVFKVRSALREK